MQCHVIVLDKTGTRYALFEKRENSKVKNKERKKQEGAKGTLRGIYRKTKKCQQAPLAKNDTRN